MGTLAPLIGTDMKLKILSAALLLALTAVGCVDNAKRDALSERIRARYSGREPIFTFLNVVARASTRPSHGSPAY